MRFEQRSKRKTSVGECRAPGCGISMLGDTTWRNASPAAREGFARHGGRGLCSKHYNRLMQAGRIELAPARPRSTYVRDCASCDRPMASQATKPEERGDRPVHRARGLCSACYQAVKRAGRLEDYAPTGSASPVLDSHLDDWEIMRDDGVSLQQAAERLGIKVSTLDKALYRARQKGDERGSLRPFALDMRRHAA